MPKITLSEFGDYQSLPLSSKELILFEAYLDEIWHQRKLFSEHPEREDSTGQAFFSLLNGNIRAKNYVGCLNFGDLEIEIYPKIFPPSSKANSSWVFQHLIYYLSYCRAFHLPFLMNEFDTMDMDDFSELWQFFFVSFCEKVLSEQAHKSYEMRTEQSTSFRGKLATSQYVKSSLSTGNWQNLVLHHSPFVYDNLFNRIVKYVMKELRSQAPSPWIEEKIEHILWLLSDVSEGVFHYTDCQKVKLNRLKIHQKLILDSCQLFLLNKQVNEQVGNFRNFTFLLPMETIYEDFVYGFISQHFPHLKAEQQSSDFLAKTRIGEKSVFQIRNDIYLPDHQLIIDTKYKLRSYPFTDEKTGVAQEDVYQMLSYCIARECRHVILLYPAQFQELEVAQKQREFVIEGGLLGNNTVEVKAIDIDISLASSNHFFQDLDKKIYEQVVKGLGIG